MKSSTKWITMAAVVTLSSTLAFAGQHEGKGGRHGRHGHGGRAEIGEKMAAKLNLTDAQKQQIKEANQAFREENRPFFDQARETRRQMREAKEAGNTALLEQLKATAKSQQEQMKQLDENRRQRVASVLTAEQRTQWDALKAERKAKREHRGPRSERGERF